MKDKVKIDTEPYKGVRDFFPEDMYVQNYIFEKMRKTATSFGYDEYSASILESTELYKGKTSDEIVNEQTYSFRDRGDREVTLRPEMTPTIARMIASKIKELPLPIRWFSIPNLFRYEKPQRGRLREHWQLNCDIFGIKNIEAEVEVMSLAFSLLSSFNLKDSDFEIKINNRKILNYILYKYLDLDEDSGKKISKIIDKKEKISDEDFRKSLNDNIGEEKAEKLLSVLSVNKLEYLREKINGGDEFKEAVDEVDFVINKLEEIGIKNTKFAITLMRGFDYYTGIVFEFFDTNEKNRRAILGGGRYDNLLAIFGKDPISGVGFGLGDVTIKDALEVRNLIPDYKSKVKLAICSTDNSSLSYSRKLANYLRENGINVTVDISGKKIGDQIKYADKKKIPYIVCVGNDEIEKKVFKIKELSGGLETSVNEEEMVHFFKK